MKAKKSEQANLENKRGLYFQLGLIVSLCLSLCAFEWSSATNPERLIKGHLQEEPIYMVDFVVPKQQQQQSSNQAKSKAVKLTTTIKVVKKEVKNPEIDSSFVDNTKIGDEGDDKPIFEKVSFTLPNITYEPHEVSISPSFPGGEEAIKKYINKTLRVPQITIEKGVPVKMYLSFVVNKKGKVVDVKFKKGKVSHQLKREAIRVLNDMPNWEPGEKDGQSVSVQQYIPINVVIK